jgi:hypothetical protein
MFSLRAIVLLAWLALGAGSLLGQEPAAREAADGATEPRTLRELIDASVKWYDVFASLEASEPAQPLVALRWANNTRGSEDGITSLYVAGGRPVAAACVYPWDGRLEYDFESLSRGPIAAKQGEAVVWQPAKAGVSFAPIPGAPPPDEKPAARLRQMKELAGRFRGTLLGWKADNSDREELRLLTKPLYRYEGRAEPIVDGAVFALAMGTDPEILLLIEAVQEGDKATWQYAFARRTSGQLEARLDDSVVWEAARFPTQRDSRLPHFTLATPLPPAIAAAEKTLEEATP